MKYNEEDSAYIDMDLKHLVKDADLLIKSSISGYDIERDSGVDHTLIYKYRKDPSYLNNIQLGTLFKIANYPNDNSITESRVIDKLFKVANSDAMSNKSKFAKYLKITRSQLNHLTDRDSMASMSLLTTNKLLNYLNYSFNKILSSQYRPIVVSFITAEGGGVGRTALSFNLGSYFEIENYRTLLIGYHTQTGLDVLAKESNFKNDRSPLKKIKISKYSEITEYSEYIDMLILNEKDDKSLRSIISDKEVRENYDYIIIDTNDDIEEPLRVTDKGYIVNEPRGTNNIDLNPIEKVKDRVSDKDILDDFENIISNFSLVGSKHDLRTSMSKNDLNNKQYVSIFPTLSVINEAYSTTINSSENKNVFRYAYKNNVNKSAVNKRLFIPMRNLVQDINSVEIFNVNTLNNKLKDGSKVKNVLELNNNINRHEVMGDLYDNYLRIKQANGIEPLSKEALCLDIVNRSNVLESTYEFKFPQYLYTALKEIVRLTNLDPRKGNYNEYKSVAELRRLLDSTPNILTLNLNSLIMIISMGLFKPDIKLQEHLLSTIEIDSTSYSSLIISGHITPSVSEINKSIRVMFIDDLLTCIDVERITLMEKYLKQESLKNDKKLVANIDLISNQFESFSKMIFEYQSMINLKIHFTLFEDLFSTFE